MTAGQAKILSDAEIDVVLKYTDTTRYPLRNKVLVLLSFKAGLREKEISQLTWNMVTDNSGNISKGIMLPNYASKGNNGGRFIPFNHQLKEALEDLYKSLLNKDPDRYIIYSEQGGIMKPKSICEWFANAYRLLNFKGCKGYSGRRTFITKLSKNIMSAGGSLRDVQYLAGHQSLTTTQRYIEGDEEAKKKVVNLI